MIAHAQTVVFTAVQKRPVLAVTGGTAANVRVGAKA